MIKNICSFSTQKKRKIQVNHSTVTLYVVFSVILPHSKVVMHRKECLLAQHLPVAPPHLCFLNYHIFMILFMPFLLPIGIHKINISSGK